MFSILNKLKWFFLNKNEKLFILSNKNEDYVGNKKKIILINTIYDYFFLLLTKSITNLKNDYIFIGLDPYILPVRSKKYFIAKHISNIWGFFSNKLLKIKWKKLYYSIRVKNIINFNIALKKDREKIHEEMISNNDSHRTIDLKTHYAILNYSASQHYKKNKFLNSDFSYRSDNNKFFLTTEKIKKIIENFSKKNIF